VHYGQGIGAILGAPFLSYKQLSFGVSFRAIYVYPPSTSFPSAMSPYTACAPAPGLVYRLAP
jgi:hypothetical protein